VQVSLYNEQLTGCELLEEEEREAERYCSLGECGRRNTAKLAEIRRLLMGLITRIIKF